MHHDPHNKLGLFDLFSLLAAAALFSWVAARLVVFLFR